MPKGMFIQQYKNDVTPQERYPERSEGSQIVRIQG